VGNFERVSTTTDGKSSDDDTATANYYCTAVDVWRAAVNSGRRVWQTAVVNAVIATDTTAVISTVVTVDYFAAANAKRAAYDS